MKANWKLIRELEKLEADLMEAYEIEDEKEIEKLLRLKQQIGNR